MATQIQWACAALRCSAQKETHTIIHTRARVTSVRGVNAHGPCFMHLCNAYASMVNIRIANMQMKERPKRVSKHKGKKSGARHMRNAAEMPLSRRGFHFGRECSAILGISETMNT